MKKIYLLSILLLSFVSTIAQTQHLSVRALSNNVALQNAIVTVAGATSATAVSDSSGSVSFQLAPGNYSLMIQHESYRTVLRPNIMIMQGNDQHLEIAMDELRVELDSVAVSTLVRTEAVDVDMWNLQRYAAVFYDPARVVNSFAALVNTDDQANNISVHGSSPAFMQWKLEGLEIVNPNHLENAGTTNDRPTLNGGGVTILSAQMLQNSGFEQAPFRVGSGNAINGLFDMRMRNGNSSRYERIIQASLLGIDLSLEGPLSSHSDASFLFNYRYSTVGLLSLMGISFGGEQIGFQDLSYTLTFPYKKGEFKIFGMNGLSSSKFKAQEDSTLIEFQKDLQNINYNSFTSINGVSLNHSLTNEWSMRTAFAWSMKNVSRTSARGPFAPTTLAEESDDFDQQKSSALMSFSRRFSNRLRIRFGSQFNYFASAIYISSQDRILTDEKITDPLLQPFIGVEGTVGERFSYSVGLHATWQTRINDADLQPRLSIAQQLTDAHKLTLSYGHNSQLQPVLLQVAHPSNENLRQTRSRILTLAHDLTWRAINLRTSIFAQQYFNLATSATTGFSSINYLNEQLSAPLDDNGQARSYGLDVTAEREVRGLYTVLSYSLYRTQYLMPDRYLDARFSTGYNLALTIGKEWTLKKKDRFVSVDIRAIQRDGFREPGVALLNEQYSYAGRLPSYFRSDLRMSFRKNKRRSSVIWALDIQNLTNAKNVAYHYFDNFTGKWEAKEQLGLIPVLSYKVMF